MDLVLSTMKKLLIAEETIYVKYLPDIQIRKVSPRIPYSRILIHLPAYQCISLKVLQEEHGYQ